jgi:hypothetical protein
MTTHQRLGPSGGRPPWLRFLSLRSVQLTAAFWVCATIAVFLIVGDGELPFGERPSLEGVLLGGEVINGWANVGVALILIGVTYLVTKGRAVPDMAARAPGRSAALAETAGLVGYGILVQFGGLLLGRAVGEHAISLHMHGTLYGADNPVSPTEATVWMLYNFVFYAVLPYLFFRQRGYSNEQLNLRSSNRANDTLLILVILLLESTIELVLLWLASDATIFGLDANQLLVGIPLAFLLNLFGTAIPIMVFIYCILLPRFLKLTGSVAATVVLGGTAYAVIHYFESWTAYDTVANGTLSVIFLMFQYFGPGMIKSVLTLRTGNAWVHVWAYHAIAPHVTVDTPNIVNVFRLR